jgi:ATP-dependent DNA helicase RecG
VTPQALKEKFDELMALPAETEWVEFKAARTSFDFDDLGRYFSALSNEANLKGQPCGWLLFGVRDKPREIVGTSYRPDRPGLDSLKREIAHKTTNRITFLDIHELPLADGRVLLFQIPAAPAGVPVAWEGHWYGRDGESIGPLNILEVEQIRGQTIRLDWSAGLCADATIADLDPGAIAKARQEYTTKNPGKAVEMGSWNDATFLSKAKVLIGGKVTRAAILLLGKDEAEHFLSPAIARMSWVLRDANGAEADYEHFGPPFLLNIESVFARIRNLRYRYLADGSLFPTEISKYEPWVIREALHNCIAHQDYTLQGRINVVEESDALVFTNLGSFIPQTVETVIDRDAPPERYRNPFLANAMVNLNMIDTIGSGIRKMFTLQRKRFFPLPDFDLSDPQRVAVRITGKVLDENYTRMLMSKTDLDLQDVIALDKVQKRLRLSEVEFRLLKSKGLVEGRRPNLFVAARVAAATGDKAAYIRNRALDKTHYMQLVVAFLRQYRKATREELDQLLLSKLSDALSAQQKRNKIRNLLQEMRRDGTIRPTGPRKTAEWVLAKPPEKPRG